MNNKQFELLISQYRKKSFITSKMLMDSPNKSNVKFKDKERGIYESGEIIMFVSQFPPVNTIKLHSNYDEFNLMYSYIIYDNKQIYFTSIKFIKKHSILKTS